MTIPQLKPFLMLGTLAFFISVSYAGVHLTQAVSVQEIKARGAKLNHSELTIKGCTKSLAVRMSENKKDYWFSFYLYPSCNPNEKQFIKVNSYRRSNGKNIRAFFSPKVNTMQIIKGKYVHGSGKDKELIGALTAKEQ